MGALLLPSMNVTYGDAGGFRGMCDMAEVHMLSQYSSLRVELLKENRWWHLAPDWQES